VHNSNTADYKDNPAFREMSPTMKPYDTRHIIGVIRIWDELE